MSRPGYRLTETADEDVENILRESRKLFGPIQRNLYAALIEKAAHMIAENPERPGSRNRDDLAARLRSFHMELAAGRRGAAAHMLYYRRERDADGIVIIRILHEAMEPALHIEPDF